MPKRLRSAVPHNGRIIEIKIANSGPDICLISHYAPHSGRPVAENEKHWDNLQQILSTKTRQAPVILLGDTNARIHGRVSDIEGSVVGRHVFGHGNHYVQELPEEQRENRQMLMDFCISNNLIISNSFFQKADSRKCTYKETRTEGFTPPWTPDRFAQLDAILVQKEWRNIVIDAESRPDIAFNSDHTFLTASIKGKTTTGSAKKL